MLISIGFVDVSEMSRNSLCGVVEAVGNRKKYFSDQLTYYGQGFKDNIKQFS